MQARLDQAVSDLGLTGVAMGFADGEEHAFEANLMRRVAGLIYVTDQESGSARLRVRQRLGLK